MNSAQLQSLVMLVILMVVFYFFLIRPQQKKVKDHQRLMDSLVQGDKVVTVGGIYGVIKSLTEETVTLEVDKGAKLIVARTAISKKR
ncbi:MAG: preprotein translocase subunit YajC [Terriglobia bacterium]